MRVILRLRDGSTWESSKTTSEDAQRAVDKDSWVLAIGPLYHEGMRTSLVRSSEVVAITERPS